MLEKTIMNNIDDHLIETIWQDLNGQVSREQISSVVAQISLEFQDAAVKAFVPIFIHRQAVEQFKRQLNENRLSANGKRPFIRQQGQSNLPVAESTSH